MRDSIASLDSAHVDKWCAVQVFLLTWAFDECSLPCTMLRQSSADEADDVDSNVHVHSNAPQIEDGIGGRGSSERMEAGMEEGVVKEGVEKAVRALSKVGPSIVCAAAAECGAFMLGASTGMPAVISFRYCPAPVDHICLLYSRTTYAGRVLYIASSPI